MAGSGTVGWVIVGRGWSREAGGLGELGDGGGGSMSVHVV